VIPRFSLVAGLALLALSCGEDTSAPEPHPAVASVVVTPDTASLILFDTLQFNASARDSAGAPISNATFTWRLEDTVDTTGLQTAALVDSIGPSALVTAITFDQTTDVIATADGVEGRATMRTRANPAASVRIKPDSITMVPGGQIAVLAEFRDAQDQPTPVHKATWASSNPSIAQTDLGETGTYLSGETVATLNASGVGTTDITLSSGSVSVTLPVKVTTVRFSDVEVIGTSSCALTTAGAPWCWGLPEFLGAGLQLWDGNATSGNSALPVAVRGGNIFTTLRTGWGGSCGLTAQGAAYCWGLNEDGLLFDVEGNEHPVPAGNGESFTDLTIGIKLICGLHPGGAASCWGSDSSGSLGDGGPPGVRKTPAPVAGGLAFSSIAGADHVCALTSAGAAYCWGGNLGGAVGNGDSTGAAVFSPVAVAGGLTFASISAGPQHTCALAPSGAAYCWGLTLGEETGAPPAEQCRVRQLDSIPFYSPCHTRPTPVGGGLIFTQITVRNGTACGLTPSGAVFCWGYLFWALSQSPLPTAMPGGISFETVGLGIGDSNVCGLGLDGFVYCIGSNTFLESGVPYGTDTSTPVRVIGQQ
jgi:hypothetical protein